MTYFTSRTRCTMVTWEIGKPGLLIKKTRNSESVEWSLVEWSKFSPMTSMYSLGCKNSKCLKPNMSVIEALKTPKVVNRLYHFHRSYYFLATISTFFQEIISPNVSTVHKIINLFTLGKTNEQGFLVLLVSVNSSRVLSTTLGCLKFCQEYDDWWIVSSDLTFDDLINYCSSLKGRSNHSAPT